MSTIKKKYLRLGTGTDELNAQDIPANYTPTNYTPDEVASEGDDKVSAHLKGINAALGTVTPGVGDIPQTTFNGANDQGTPADVTDFVFSVSDAFEALVFISVDATADLYETQKLLGVKKGASWSLSVTSVGDLSGVVLSITSGGQIQYTSEDYAGFASLTIQFRASAL